MTTPAHPRRRRPHPAASARWTAAGLGLCATFSLVGALGVKDALVARSTPATTVDPASATVGGSTASTSNTLPGSGRRPSATASVPSGSTDGATHGSR